MPFFGIEDGFGMHPKVVAAGNAAIGAWARMGAHCVAHGTNGFISEKEAKIYATSGQLKRLLQCVITDDGVGLFVEAEQNGVKGFRFHDWTQPDIETIRHKREVRAAAGRKGGQASARSRAFKSGSVSKEWVQAIASPNAEANRQASAQASAQAKPKQNPSTEDIGLKEVPTQVSANTYVSDAPARSGDAVFDLATSERGSDLSRPVTVGASRLVASIVRHGAVSDADRTILRIKASELASQGRSEDDIAECLRIWLTKNDLGPHALGCCMTEVDKRKINGATKLATADLRVLQGEALKAQFRTPIGELESGH